MFSGNCRLGENDLGAIMVGIGWTFSFRKESDRFAETEERAKQAKLGRWQGEFVHSWMWLIRH